jgi:hypothetical protein
MMNLQGQLVSVAASGGLDGLCVLVWVPPRLLFVVHGEETWRQLTGRNQRSLVFGAARLTPLWTVCSTGARRRENKAAAPNSLFPGPLFPTPSYNSLIRGTPNRLRFQTFSGLFSPRFSAAPVALSAVKRVLK